MSFLISADWTLNEAQRLKIHVSAHLVRRTFDRLRAQQFRTQGQFQRFLNETGQTVADLLFRVEQTLLAQQITKHVIEARHGARSRQQALTRFVKAFRRRWRAQTYCATSFAVADCGSVESVL